MTDEERARLDNFIWSVGGLTDEAEIERHALAFEAAIRADQREKCAKEVEALMRPDPSPFATSMMAALNSNLRDAAAAIRAMGDKP